jgi:hypothetical protein
MLLPLSHMCVGAVEETLLSERPPIAAFAVISFSAGSVRVRS